MKTHPTVVAAILVGITCAAHAEVTSVKAPYPSVGSVERLDPALDALLSPEAKIEKLAEGFTWSEGPVWVKAGGYLLFSDVPANTVYRWKDGEGVSVYLKPSGFLGENFPGKEPGSNGLTIDPQGRLVLCQHGERQVARMDAPLDHPMPKFAPIAHALEGIRFNSPNDLCYTKNGSLYFTDPPYGLPTQQTDDPRKESPIQGVYRVGLDGKISVVVPDMERPNGLAFSPDEKTLYVNNSHGPRPVMMAYDVQPDGTVKNGRVFYSAQPLLDRKLPGALDGMKVDAAGNIWSAAPGGVIILSPAGKALGLIAVGTNTGNCAWGDDGSTLYICANHEIWRVRTKAARE